MLTLLALLSLFVYLLLGWHFCQTRLAGKHALSQGLSIAALSIGLTAHGVLIAHTLMQSPTFFGAAEALSLTAWLAILIYCLGKTRWNLDGLEPPLFAFSAAFMVLALALPQGHQISYAQSGLSRAHFLLAMFAQSFLFIAAGLAVLMRLTDSTLHQHARKMLARKLPPLLTLEKLLFGTIATGFILLSAALVAGSLLNLQAHGIVVQWSHKTLFGLSSWLLFGTLLLGNYLRGWRGRFAANWTLVAFSVLFLGYIGTRIVLEAFLNKG